MSSESGSEDLSGLARSIHGLFDREFPVPAALEDREASSHGGGQVAWVAESGVRLPGDVEGPDPLAEAVAAYLSAEGPDRTEDRRRLEAAAEDARARRAAGALADAAEVLARISAERPEALEVARRLVTPGVATVLVARLSESEDDDGRRDQMVHVLAVLGGEVEEAVLEAFRREAPDPASPRSVRRSLLAVVKAFADRGSDILERMVGEPDWRIVRNAIHLMGERETPGMIQHLTVALGHSDGRVRKETLKALSKLEGEDATMLAMGALDDSDSGVRAQAARTLGLLHAERALRPLLSLLDREEVEAVQVEVIRALGLLGDPSAVIPLEKRAVSHFFSRTSQVVRVAAYRALGAIGTPHAMELVRGALEDRDPEVRRTAQAVLDVNG